MFDIKIHSVCIKLYYGINEATNESTGHIRHNINGVKTRARNASK